MESVASLDAAELTLSNEQARIHPALSLIAAMPALHSEANLLDNERADSITFVLAKVKRIAAEHITDGR